MSTLAEKATNSPFSGKYVAVFGDYSFDNNLLIAVFGNFVASVDRPLVADNRYDIAAALN